MSSNTIYFVFVILPLIGENLCNNVTGAYNTMRATDFQSRTNRLLTFNTHKDGDIRMEVAFNVPFITIPVKKSLDMAHGALANINLGAVVLAGAIAFGIAVVIPGLMLLMSKKSLGPTDAHRRDDTHSWWQYLEIAEKVLSENDVDSTSCMQRMICWIVSNSAKNVMKGGSSSSDKIIDGLATNKLLRRFVQGTIIQEALNHGLDDTDCSKHYNHCKVSQNTFAMFQSIFSESINN